MANNKNEAAYQYAELTGQVIGCAMRVHREVGAGFPEVVYQRCLAIELRYAGVLFEQEIHLPLYYREESVGSRRADFLVAGVVLVELKATTELVPSHHAQIINYLNAYKLQVGLLINFGQESLAYKRFVKTHH
ncbi:MAG: GxxExxY protein [Janthinobacterium lividum]